MGFRKKARRQRNQKMRAKYETCKECGERAVRPQLHWFWAKVGTYQCDACHSTFANYPESDQSNLEDVWKGDAPEDIELHDEATKNDPVINFIKSFPNKVANIPRILTNFHKEVSEEVDEGQSDIELTPQQKSKKNLSTVCFVLAILSGITIVGLPVAILFLILAAWLTPEPYEEKKSTNAED